MLPQGQRFKNVTFWLEIFPAMSIFSSFISEKKATIRTLKSLS